MRNRRSIVLAEERFGSMCCPITLAGLQPRATPCMMIRAGDATVEAAADAAALAALPAQAGPTDAALAARGC
jgi:hypothetical protein